MRGMVFVKATEESEKGFVRTPETEAMRAAMGRFNDERVAAGILKAGACDGLQPASTAPHLLRRCGAYRHRRPLHPGPRPGHRLVAVDRQGQGRSGRLGEALSGPDAGPSEREIRPFEDRPWACRPGACAPATPLNIILEDRLKILYTPPHQAV